LFPKTKTDQEKFEVEKYFKGYKRIERIVSTFVWFNIANFVVSPFLKFAKSGKWIQKFPFEVWLPFDPYGAVAYNFVLLAFFNNTVIVICSTLAADFLLYGLITNISMQFDILCREIVELQNAWQCKIEKQFVELVEKQITLTKLSAKLENIYSASILMNLLGSSLFICLFGFLITSREILSDFLLEFSLSLISLLIQIFLLCFYGNKLTTASGNVAKAAYDSGWHEMQNKMVKKSLVLMMQRSQRPTVLKGLKFIAVSLAAFTTVCIVRF
jgi:odorant receptor